MWIPPRCYQGYAPRTRCLSGLVEPSLGRESTRCFSCSFVATQANCSITACLPQHRAHMLQGLCLCVDGGGEEKGEWGVTVASVRWISILFTPPFTPKLLRTTVRLRLTDTGRRVLGPHGEKNTTHLHSLQLHAVTMSQLPAAPGGTVLRFLMYQMWPISVVSKAYKLIHQHCPVQTLASWQQHQLYWNIGFLF